MKNKISPQIKSEKKGWLKRFLDWLGKGAAKAKKDGALCSR